MRLLNKKIILTKGKNSIKKMSNEEERKKYHSQWIIRNNDYLVLVDFEIIIKYYNG